MGIVDCETTVGGVGGIPFLPCSKKHLMVIDRKRKGDDGRSTGSHHSMVTV